MKHVDSNKKKRIEAEWGIIPRNREWELVNFLTCWSQHLKTHSFKRSHNVPPDRFPGMMVALRLISSTWEEMKDANRLCLSDVAADYLISLSNWPESDCICFASAELTYLYLIFGSKSIEAMCLFLCLENIDGRIHSSLSHDGEVMSRKNYGCNVRVIYVGKSVMFSFFLFK